MSDHITNPAYSPEALLDQWLDALNDPARFAPHDAPGEIGELAATARRYHDVLGMANGAAVWHIAQERNEMMPDQALTHTEVVRGRRTVAAQAPAGRRGSIAWLSNRIASAMLVGLLILLTGGLARQFGPPAGVEGLLDSFGLVAPGDETPGSRDFSCAMPGYRPIVEGDGDAQALASLGITRAPIRVSDGQITIPTSFGETVTLPGSWTSMGGPMWADIGASGGSVTIRNIETGEEWTFPGTNPFFPGVYSAPYLLVPASSDKRDWRIIDTTTGEERLVSEIRGEPFQAQLEISLIDDHSQPPVAGSTSTWLFSSFSTPTTISGPNLLILPPSLAKARFLPDTVDATYFHELAYSSATQRFAYATGDGMGRSIVVVDPQAGDQMVIQDERFTGQALPLMFSDDGTTLIVDQRGALFSVSLRGEPIVTLVYEGEKFVPVAHNARSMNVVVMFEDRHVAIVNARSGEATNQHDVTVPEYPYAPDDPMLRMSFEMEVLDLFDTATSTVRFIDLISGTVSTVTPVLDHEVDEINAPLQPEFQLIVDYPFATWPGSYAYVDAQGALHAVSITTDDEILSILPPDDFSVESNQVVQLLVTPGGRCAVMNIANGAGVSVHSAGETSERVTSWIAPLEPGAQWTRLDVAITGWRVVYEVPMVEMSPETGIASPVATPS
jgi:hypothetical protein